MVNWLCEIGCEEAKPEFLENVISGEDLLDTNAEELTVTETASVRSTC